MLWHIYIYAHMFCGGKQANGQPEYNKIMEYINKERNEHKECSFVIEAIFSTMYRQHVWWWWCFFSLTFLCCCCCCAGSINSVHSIHFCCCFFYFFLFFFIFHLFACNFINVKRFFALIFKYVQRLFRFSTVGNQILAEQMPHESENEKKWKWNCKFMLIITCVICVWDIQFWRSE